MKLYWKLRPAKAASFFIKLWMTQAAQWITAIRGLIYTHPLPPHSE